MSLPSTREQLERWQKRDCIRCGWHAYVAAYWPDGARAAAPAVIARCGSGAAARADYTTAHRHREHAGGTWSRYAPGDHSR